jgi:hypothetical protein
MMKTMVVLSSAQASALLAAYHVLDEITTHMEQHDLEDSEAYSYALDGLNCLDHVLECEDTIWDDGAVVLKGEE